MSETDEPTKSSHRLASISTMWTVLRAAHTGRPSEAADARSLLLRRYGGAIYRYLLGAVRDPQVAEELAQEFALRLVQGSFRHVSPERGKFRSYVKTVLFHMVSEHRKRASRRARSVPLEDVDVADPTAGDQDPDEAFQASWRDEILARVWSLLEASHAQSYQVLRYKAEHPDATSDDIARRLSDSHGAETSAANIRQVLHRARERFSNLLLQEVAHSLDDPTDEAVDEELIELGLYQYCRRAKASAREDN
jgi:RNA polymerase sigma-70 factor (ECF subfamily)